MVVTSNRKLRDSSFRSSLLKKKQRDFCVNCFNFFNPGLSAVFEQDFVYQAVINVLDLLD